jgi:hypothetical protein
VFRRGGAESDVFLPSPELKRELSLQFRRGAGVRLLALFLNMLEAFIVF